MIFTYNKEHVGDVLMVIVKDSKGAKLDYERKGNVSRVFLEKNGETVAWNIFEVSSLIAIDGVGQVTLSDEDVAKLNAELTKEGFSEQLENDPSPKFVVGQIKEMVAHPDSDHLNICQVQISDDKNCSNRRWCTKRRSWFENNRCPSRCYDAKRKPHLPRCPSW